MEVETRSQDEIWSPSKDNNISHIANVARQTIVRALAERISVVPESEKSELWKRAGDIEKVLLRFESTANAEKLIALEAELEQVCETGRKAEAALIEAKNDELRVRNDDAERSNYYNAASRKLANATNAPLPNFYNNADVETKLQRIADASEEVKRAESELARHPNAIPQAVHVVREAERTLNELIAREKMLRKEIAALCGEPVEPTNGNATTRFSGLAR